MRISTIFILISQFCLMILLLYQRNYYQKRDSSKSTLIFYVGCISGQPKQEVDGTERRIAESICTEIVERINMPVMITNIDVFMKSIGENK